MSNATLTGNAPIDPCDQEALLVASAPAPVMPGLGLRKAGAARALRVGLQRVTDMRRRMRMALDSYCDPLFERPDLIEDDYYRMRNQPRD